MAQIQSIQGKNSVSSGEACKECGMRLWACARALQEKKRWGDDKDKASLCWLYGWAQDGEDAQGTFWHCRDTKDGEGRALHQVTPAVLRETMHYLGAKTDLHNLGDASLA